MAEVLLLSLPASPFAMSVKIALAEKGVSYDVHEEKFPNKSELLLKYSPVTKQVPVLIHRGKPVCESLVILEYIDEVWKDQGTKLFPEDPYERAVARFWANYGNLKFWETALLVMKRLGDEQSKASKGTLDLYMSLEEELNKVGCEKQKPFFGGERLNIADVVMAPVVSWKLALETLGKFKFPEVGRMAEWMKAIEEHPSVKASIASPDYILENALFFQERLKQRQP